MDPRPACLAALDADSRSLFNQASAHYRDTGRELVPFGRLAVAMWFRLGGSNEVEILPPEALSQTLAHPAAAPGAETLARDFWHPVPFYTTWRAGAKRLGASGHDGYEPNAYRTGLFERAWPRFRRPLEAHWQPYLDGEISLEEAARRLMSAVAGPP